MMVAYLNKYICFNSANKVVIFPYIWTDIKSNSESCGNEWFFKLLSLIPNHMQYRDYALIIRHETRK